MTELIKKISNDIINHNIKRETQVLCRYACKSTQGTRLEPEREETGRQEYHVALFLPALSQQQQDTLFHFLDSHIAIA